MGLSGGGVFVFNHAIPSPCDSENPPFGLDAIDVVDPGPELAPELHPDSGWRGGGGRAGY